MQRNHYEISFTSGFLLDDGEIDDLKQLITDFLTPEEQHGVISIDHIDSEGYDE